MSEQGPWDSTEFDALLDAVLEGGTTPEQVERLNALLRSDARARARYIAYLDLHAALADSAGPLSIAFDTDVPDDRADIMSEVIASALAERHRHEVEDEAGRRLAEQQAREARDREYLIRRQQPPPREIVIPKPVLWLGLAALIGLIAWLGWPENDGRQPSGHASHQGETDVPGVMTTINNIAVIRNSVDARWASGAGVDSPYLQGGKVVTLRSGLAQIVFGDATTVILEGPVTIEPTGPDGLRLVAGRLTVSAPASSSGFYVETSEFAVSHTGADFGVYADRDTGGEAVAIAGEITVQRRDAAGLAVGGATRLGPGSGATVGPAGIEVARSPALAFVGVDEFDSRSASASGDPYARWLAHGYTLRRDPSVVAYYVFDQDDAEQGVLTNRAGGQGGETAGRLGNGAEIAAPRWAPGRFEQTRSLRFGDATGGRSYGVVVPDHRTLDLDGEMSFALWVRGANPSRFSGTLLSKRDVPPRRMNFQVSIMPEWHAGGKELQFGAGEDDPSSRGFVYSQASGRLATGTWTHVAFTTDGRTVRYYINGERVHSSRQPLPALTNSADLLIGTSAAGGGASHFDVPQPFYGEISEVLIADRAFSSDEIRELYRTSRGGP